MANRWIAHLKKYRAAHPGMSLGDAMKKAAASYKKTAAEPKKKTKKRKAKKTKK
jgi:hypothetical protein